jgi:uridine kinase
VVYLVHDAYYKDLSHLSLLERASMNFDHPDSLDTDLMIQHIRHLKEGRSVEVPTYDFSTHSRTETPVTVEPKRIILVEGILILCNPELVQEMNLKVFVVRCSDSLWCVCCVSTLVATIVSRARRLIATALLVPPHFLLFPFI